MIKDIFSLAVIIIIKCPINGGISPLNLYVWKVAMGQGIRVVFAPHFPSLSHARKHLSCIVLHRSFRA